MLDSRDYMREPAYGARERISLTTILIVVNVAAFCLQQAAYRIFQVNPMRVQPTDYWFALSVDGLKDGFIWQLITYQFMHGGFLHLAMNCLGLFLLGRVLEQTMSRTKFLALYLVSGVGGGLFQALGTLVFPKLFGGYTVGASAGVFGLLAAFAAVFPRQQVSLLFLPIPMSARVLVAIFGGCAFLGLWFANDNVAHGAHLGGMITGYLFARYSGQIRFPAIRFRPRMSQRKMVQARVLKHPEWQAEPEPTTEEATPEEFISREVDPILDKISAHGIQSLTERERKILESAKKRMAER